MFNSTECNGKLEEPNPLSLRFQYKIKFWFCDKQPKVSKKISKQNSFFSLSYKEKLRQSHKHLGLMSLLSLKMFDKTMRSNMGTNREKLNN